MKNNVIVLLLAGFVLFSVFPSAFAQQDTIKIKGQLVYLEDFEGDISDSYFKSKNNVFDVAASDFGGKALRLTASSVAAFGTELVGPEAPFADGVVEMDVKIDFSKASSLGSVSLGVRASENGSALRFDYIDTTNKTTPKKYDVVSVGYSNTTFDADKFSYIEYSEKVNAQKQPSYPRYFDEYYTLSAVLDADALKAEMLDADGNSVASAATTVQQIEERVGETLNESGRLLLGGHNINATIDNVRVFDFLSLSSIQADTVAASIYEEKPLIVKSEDGIEIPLLSLSFGYNDELVLIDRVKGTVKPLVIGTIPIEIAATDVHTGERRTCIAYVNSQTGIRADLSDYNTTISVPVMLSVKEITNAGENDFDGDFSVETSDGAFYNSDTGEVSAVQEGVYTITVTADGKKSIAYLAVTDSAKALTVKDALIYSENFEGAVDSNLQHASKYSLVDFTKYEKFGTVKNKAAQYNGQGAIIGIGPFGPTEEGGTIESLSDYAIEADVKLESNHSDNVSQVSFALRTQTAYNGKEDAYRALLAPLIKMDAEDIYYASNGTPTYNVFSVARSAYNRQIDNGWLIGQYTKGTRGANVGGTHPGGIFDGSNSSNDIAYKWQIMIKGSPAEGGEIDFAVKNISNNRLLTQVNEKLANLGKYKTASGNTVDADPLLSGATMLGFHNTRATIDNIKMYSLYEIKGLKSLTAKECNVGDAVEICMQEESTECVFKEVDISDMMIESLSKGVMVTDGKIIPFTKGRHFLLVTRAGIANGKKQAVVALDASGNTELNRSKFEVTDSFISYQNGEGAAQALVAEGTLVAEVSIKHREDAPAKAVVIAALYTKDNVLKSLVTTDVTFNTAQTVKSQRLEITLPSVIDEDRYAIYVWENLSEIVPIPLATEDIALSLQ